MMRIALLQGETRALEEQQKPTPRPGAVSLFLQWKDSVMGLCRGVQPQGASAGD